MTFLWDSDWIIDYLRGRPDAVALFRVQVVDGIAASVVAYAEVYEGIYYGADAEQNEATFNRVLAAIELVPVDRSVAHRAAIIRGDLRARGLMIPHPDIFIAATAIVHDLILVTRNTRDFGRVAGLRLNIQQ